MEISRKGLALFVASVGIGLLVASVALRRPRVPRDPSKTIRVQRENPPSTAQNGSPQNPTTPAPTPRKPVMNQAEFRAAIADMKVRDTYRSYRDAVAQRNEAAASAILPFLVRDRAAALQCARDEMTRATTERDRESARKTFETLSQ